jgi:hypothetical protein
MKRFVLLNILWTIIAAGTFYAGARWHQSQRNSGEVSRAAIRRVDAPEPPARVGDDKGAVKGRAVAAAVVSRDDSVLDFYRRYHLDGTAPLSPETMKEAVAEALRETDPIKSQMLFSRLMQELTPENATAALAMIRENVGGFEGGRFTGLLAYAWGAVDPVSAMAELGKTTGDRGGRFGQGSVLSGWASKDPAAAIAWLDKQEGDNKDWLTQSLVSGLAKSDPQAAFKYASGLKDDGDRTRSAETIARELIRTGGLDQAATWLGQLTDVNMKRGAFDAVAQQYWRSDPAKAAEFVKGYANEDFARGAISNLAQNIARENPQKGLEFAAALGGTAQARAYQEVIGEWLDRDRGKESLQASEYVSKMPAGPNRDAGAEAIARNIVREDPAAAIAWSNSIQDPANRQETLVDIGRRYVRMNPQAATAWLAQSGLSAEAQQQVLAPPEEGRWGGDRGDRFRGREGFIGRGGGGTTGRQGGPNRGNRQ